MTAYLVTMENGELDYIETTNSAKSVERIATKRNNGKVARVEKLYAERECQEVTPNMSYQQYQLEVM